MNGRLSPHLPTMSPLLRINHAAVSIDASSSVDILRLPDGSAEKWVASFAAPADTVGDIPGLGAGTLSCAEAVMDGLRLVREVFRPDGDGDVCAVRVRLANTGHGPIAVHGLVPLAIGEDGLRLGDTPVSDWRFMRQPRKKNDMPAVVRLGDTTPRVWDAFVGTPETGGAPRTDASTPPTTLVSSEATVIATNDHAVLFGVFPLHKQLVRMRMAISADRQRLEAFEVCCECDGQLLPPGAEVASQWVLVRVGRDPFAALDAYADVLLQTYPDAAERKNRRATPPTVWCSWYYYGASFSQNDAEENLQFLRDHPLPVDVFQIDDCWARHWGDWSAGDRWPGVAEFAARIATAGYRPGIWTCPFLAENQSTLRNSHPEWLLRDNRGEPIVFPMNGMKSVVLDPTHPEVLDFLEALFRRLTHEWGYTYHKIDFTRAVADPDAVFRDQSMNRAQAYRTGLEAIRRGIGADGYLDVCGGLYGPSLGIADAQRSGSDVRSTWPSPPSGEERDGYGPFTIKQNVLRGWMNRLWDNDPDALMVRRRSEAFRDMNMSLGDLTDEEALTCALNQYLAGGLVCLTERFTEVEPDRLYLLRHCSPSVARATIPRDAFDDVRFPSVLDTAVEPWAAGLEPWHALSLVNWHGVQRPASVTIGRTTLGEFADSADAFRITSFRTGETRIVDRDGVYDAGSLPAHGCDVLKVQPCRADRPQLLWTNGHFSMGGREVRTWTFAGASLHIGVDWHWPVPLKLCIAPPAGRRFADQGSGDALCITIDRSCTVSLNLTDAP